MDDPLRPTEISIGLIEDDDEARAVLIFDTDEGKYSFMLNTEAVDVIANALAMARPQMREAKTN